MKIFNLHTNDERDVEDIKVVTYEEYDKNGKMKNNKYVQFTIISDRSWTDFMPVSKFKKLNPKVNLLDISN